MQIRLVRYVELWLFIKLRIWQALISLLISFSFICGSYTLHYIDGGVCGKSAIDSFLRTSASPHTPDEISFSILTYVLYLTQVWFQNARAKHRRVIIKQDGDKKSPDHDGSSQSTGRWRHVRHGSNQRRCRHRALKTRTNRHELYGFFRFQFISVILRPAVYGTVIGLHRAETVMLWGHPAWASQNCLRQSSTIKNNTRKSIYSIQRRRKNTQ